MIDNHHKQRVVFITFGCKTNYYDTAAMMALLDKERFEVIDAGGAVDEGLHPDVVVINTCTVTHKSDFQSRQMVRRVRRAYPQARILVTGCLAETSPDSLIDLGCDALIGVQKRERIISWINRDESEIKPAGESIFFHAAAGIQKRTRPLVKIQDGCNFACAYCIVPKARGQSRSLTEGQVIGQLRAAAAAGHAEAVLTGIHIGMYGMDKGTDFLSLLRRIEGEPGLPLRIRISSIEPQEITPALIDHLSQSRILCRHLHLPMQSGDDEILSLMRRRYTADDFSSLIRHLHQRIPGLCVGLDLIAGFPGETAQHFQRTLALLHSLPFAYLHVFPFSARQGTPAWHMSGKVSPQIIKERCRILRELGRSRRAEFYHRHQGAVLTVLAEQEKNGELSGWSDNYVRVCFPGARDDEGRLVSVRISGVRGNTAVGEMC